MRSGLRTAMALAVLLAVAACERAPQEAAPELRLTPVAFSELPGWQVDHAQDALVAFLTSCPKLESYPSSREMGALEAFGVAADWQQLCAKAKAASASESAARTFFEAGFTPYRASDGSQSTGLFTGYFEPLLRGSRSPDRRYRWPLYRRPSDLVTADLEAFDPDLKGRQITGRIENGRFIPYYDRKAVDDGALGGKSLELLWVDDPIDRFFLEIQGSGQITLADGSRTRVGYADKNGRPYRAIGRDLVDMGELTIDEVSLQSIRNWLETHSERAFEIMHKNPSIVFFQEHKELAEKSGPLGAMNLPLTAGRSLAVDRRFIPLGIPIWIDTVAPFPDGDVPLQRLVIAQDTGGAIKGPVRGDVFWGSGAMAEHVAGHMRSQGSYYLLLPRRGSPSS